MRHIIAFLVVMQISVSALFCKEKEEIKIFSHEYMFYRINIYEVPQHSMYMLFFMTEPTDTLVFDMDSVSSVLSSIRTDSMIFSDSAVIRVFVDLYGMSKKAETAYNFFMCDFSEEYSKNLKAKTFRLRDGFTLEVSYFKIVGLFAKYDLPNSYHYLVYTFGEKGKDFRYICPLHILYSESIENLIIKDKDR